MVTTALKLKIFYAYFSLFIFGNNSLQLVLENKSHFNGTNLEVKNIEYNAKGKQMFKSTINIKENEDYVLVITENSIRFRLIFNKDTSELHIIEENGKNINELKLYIKDSLKGDTARLTMECSWKKDNSSQFKQYENVSIRATQSKLKFTFSDKLKEPCSFYFANSKSIFTERIIKNGKVDIGSCFFYQDKNIISEQNINEFVILGDYHKGRSYRRAETRKMEIKKR